MNKTRLYLLSKYVSTPKLREYKLIYKSCNFVYLLFSITSSSLVLLTAGNALFSTLPICFAYHIINKPTRLSLNVRIMREAIQKPGVPMVKMGKVGLQYAEVLISLR